MPLPYPLALPTLSFSHFLTFLLSHSHSHSNPSSTTTSPSITSCKPITLIICSARSTFLTSLLSRPLPHSDSHILHTHDHHDHHDASLLQPTLSLLSLCRSTSLVFAPTIPHLRAYLASLTCTSGGEGDGDGGMLAIYGLVQLHSGEGGEAVEGQGMEFSAQGLARTLSIAVSTAVVRGKWLVVGVPPSSSKALDTGIEHSQHEEEEQSREGVEDGERQRSDNDGGSSEMFLPILNSTGIEKLAGGRAGRRGWGGNTGTEGVLGVLSRRRVPVKEVFGRWFVWGEVQQEE